MISLNSPMWEELSTSGNNTAKLLRNLMEGTGDFCENMMFLAEDLSCQFQFYEATAYYLPYLAALCPKRSLEDKVYMITQIGLAIAAEAYQEFEEGLCGLRCETIKVITDPTITAILGNDFCQDQEFVLSVLAILGDRIHAYGMYPMFGAMNKEGFAVCSCGFETTELSFENDLEYFHSLVRESYRSEQFIAMTHVGNFKLLIEKLEHMHDFSI